MAIFHKAAGWRGLSVPVLRGLLGTASLFLLALFAAPLLSFGILNVGNATGIALCSAVLCYSVFMKKINVLLQKFWRTRAGRRILIPIAVFASLAALIALVESALIFAYSHHNTREERTAVVLGCHVYGTIPSVMLAERLNAAIRYLNAHPQAECILSGGQGRGEAISEAECMYRYLTAHGIDGSRLYKEDLSTSTRENLLFSKTIIANRSLPPRIAVITNGFHEYRACLLAQKLGMDARPVAARTRKLALPTYFVRELYGIAWTWGWGSSVQ